MTDRTTAKRCRRFGRSGSGTHYCEKRPKLPRIHMVEALIRDSERSKGHLSRYISTRGKKKKKKKSSIMLIKWVFQGTLKSL